MKELHGNWESSRAWRELAPIIANLLPLLGESKTAEVHCALAGVNCNSLERLRAHRLLPLIFREVARRGMEKELPGAVFAELRNAYLLAFQEAASQEAEIPQVLRALGKAGIEALILKGADVRHRLYDDPAVRPMADLDLLIPSASCGKPEKFWFNSDICRSRSRGPDLRNGLKMRFFSSGPGPMPQG